MRTGDAREALLPARVRTALIARDPAALDAGVEVSGAADDAQAPPPTPAPAGAVGFADRARAPSAGSRGRRHWSSGAARQRLEPERTERWEAAAEPQTNGAAQEARGLFDRAALRAPRPEDPR